MDLNFQNLQYLDGMVGREQITTAGVTAAGDWWCGFLMSSVDYYLHDGSKIGFIIRRQILLASRAYDLQATQERNGLKKQYLLLKR